MGWDDKFKEIYENWKKEGGLEWTEVKQEICTNNRMVSNHKDKNGNIVCGQVNPKTNLLHGFGILIVLDGRVFEGQWNENETC